MDALRNAWYVAAWDRDLGRVPLSVKVLDEAIVLYRQGDGTPAALEDACPHRKLPLSRGRIQGDWLECGYHGLTFDALGQCRRAPGSDRIPRGAQVRAYPVIARYAMIWIWMGDAQLADPAKIFPIPEWSDPAWGRNNGDTMDVECHYLYVTDNLLDPSHVAWVHQSSIADTASANVPVDIRASADGSGLAVTRWTRDVEVAPFYRQFTRFTGRCDRLQHYEVRYPCHAIIQAVFVPSGAGGPAAHSHPEAFVMNSYNFMTPIDAANTRYFWFQTRNFAPGDSAASEAMTDGIRKVFKEDQAVLKAVQIGMTQRRTPNIDIAVDAGPLRFRRQLARLIAAERESAAVAIPQNQE
jgi:phenylpropionate dioxygenase-like ring-hydroxylating dioxygenase large terminal subunit